MYLAQFGLSLCLISKICRAELSKDIEQIKILADGPELNNRELTQGERDLAMFPEVYSKDSHPDHGITSESKGPTETTRVVQRLAKGDAPIGSPARSSSAIDGERSSDDGSISSISGDKQGAHSVLQHEKYIQIYDDAAHQHLQDPLSHYRDDFGFDQYAMHSFPITNQYQTSNLNQLPYPDVVIQLPAFSNPADAASYSPVGQAMAVTPAYLNPGFESHHMQAVPALYNTHFPYDSHLGYDEQLPHFSAPIDPIRNLQNFWPPHISNSQNVRSTGRSVSYGSQNSYKNPPPSIQVQNPPRTKPDGSKSAEQKAVPEKLFEQKTKESNKAPDLQNPIWKEHDRTKSSLPKSEAMKSSEGREPDGPRSSTESIPIAPTEIKAPTALNGKGKTLEEFGDIITPISAKTSGSMSQHMKNSDEKISEIKPITTSLWADIVSQKVKEQRLARSSLTEKNSNFHQGQHKTLVKEIKIEKTIAQLGSGVNPKTPESKSDFLVNTKQTSNSEEWKEYYRKKGRKVRFSGRQTSAQEDALPNDLNSQDKLSGSYKILDEQKAYSHAPDDVSVTETRPQEVTKPLLEDMSHTSRHAPNEFINLVSDASEIKPVITEKIKASRKKQKSKSYKTRTKAQGDRFQVPGNLKTAADVLDSETFTPGSFSPPPNIGELAARLDDLLSKVLQKNDPRNRIRIDFDEASYEKLLKINPLSEDIWSQCRNKFLIDFDNPNEAQRRWNSLANQIDQRIATKHWKDMAPILAEPIKEVALRFKIDKEWPTFVEITMEYAEQTMKLLEQLTPEHKETLATLFGNKLLRVRVATVYVTSRRSRNAKQFEKAQLIDFMKRGGIVPSLYEIHDCLEMKLSEVNWEAISKGELKSRTDRIIKAMTGRISIGDQALELTKQDWTSSYTREYLSRPGAAKNSVDFMNRLKRFAKTATKELQSQSIYSWWGVPISARSDHPWANEMLTPAEVLAASNCDLTIGAVGIMIHTLKQNSQLAIQQGNLDEKIIYWPVNASQELIPRFMQFKEYYKFLGFDLIYPLYQKL